MAVAQRLIEMSAVEIIRHNACSILELFLIGDQALAFRTLFYRATYAAAIRWRKMTHPRRFWRSSLRNSRKPTTI